MKHVFVEDDSIDISTLEHITKVEACIYCDTEIWHWVSVMPGKIKHNRYMLYHGTQYWDPNEECPNPYNMKEVKQLKLF